MTLEEALLEMSKDDDYTGLSRCGKRMRVGTDPPARRTFRLDRVVVTRAWRGHAFERPPGVRVDLFTQLGRDEHRKVRMAKPTALLLPRKLKSSSSRV